ncbi:MULTISPECIES: hypothetical protein [Thermomonosporaceae]|uniref:hypothetical protein n=1 Tax=Thermomonosporaceae TaxID=2012 RepID=UPI00255AED6A|nr:MULTISPECIES: hypothetical protein [Thermomonosporaceae]MDL4772687.1 hypothetical protein [Actinomadura xylanilytica]
MSTDEPLEGDIGPAAHIGRATAASDDPGVPGGSPTGGPTWDERRRAEAEELLRYEAERQERRRRANAVSGRIAFGIAAVLLAFLAYDSVRTATEAHTRGDDWVYPPAVNAGICGIALIVLAGWAIRRRSRRR